MKTAKSKLERNRRYYLHGILKDLHGFDSRNRVLNGNPIMTARQKKAMNELCANYGYVIQTEIIN